jgi:hypothetical protein
MRRIQSNDPRPLTIRFRITCAKCGKTLKPNDQAYYWPSSRKIFCLDCGNDDFKAFLSSVCDEKVYNGSGNPFYS